MKELACIPFMPNDFLVVVPAALVVTEAPVVASVVSFCAMAQAITHISNV